MQQGRNCFPNCRKQLRQPRKKLKEMSILQCCGQRLKGRGNTTSQMKISSVLLNVANSVNKLNTILAVDPGFDRIGVAVLEKEKVLFSDCIVTNRKISHANRLFEIGKAIQKIIKKWEPNSLAIESLFFNQNVTNAMKVSEARGVILYEAAQAKLKIFEYSPQAVKIAVTGYGKADKKQIANMVKKLIRLSSKKMLDDEIDAIALGITHLATQKGI